MRRTNSFAILISDAQRVGKAPLMTSVVLRLAFRARVRATVVPIFTAPISRGELARAGSPSSSRHAVNPASDISSGLFLTQLARRQLPSGRRATMSVTSAARSIQNSQRPRVRSIGHRIIRCYFHDDKLYAAICGNIARLRRLRLSPQPHDSRISTDETLTLRARGCAAAFARARRRPTIVGSSVGRIRRPIPFTENLQQFANDVKKTMRGKAQISFIERVVFNGRRRSSAAVQGGQAQAGEILARQLRERDPCTESTGLRSRRVVCRVAQALQGVAKGLETAPNRGICCSTRSVAAAADTYTKRHATSVPTWERGSSGDAVQPRDRRRLPYGRRAAGTVHRRSVAKRWPLG